MLPRVHPFFDKATGTISYLVFDDTGGHAAIIDPVLNYQASSGAISTESADLIVAAIEKEKLTVDWILETHAHADHLSAAHFLKEKVGGKIAIGQRIDQVQQTFKKTFNLDATFPADGSQFDHLFADDDIFHIGKLRAQVLGVPGHTPADVAYQIGDAIFVGDTLFMPDVGTARCDFPGGDARALFGSIKKLLRFPDQTRLFMCHDYPTTGRDVRWESTVLEQRRSNIHINDSIDQATFILRRTTRDATLTEPELLMPSILVNIHAGRLTELESDGMLKLTTKK